MNAPYRSPRIFDLGSAVELTEGSYPSTPDTVDNVHSGKKAAKKTVKKAVKKTAKKATKKR